ncbi:cellulose synthase/poly-beta-1,6-N-acetylglucosamine synthase-like glycosyltransferase [Devosia sp. UYZn731]|uniref:glycosyltransferase family 2 protein n=1 Tax=Devosia sp. UYZn731 TaxID=3156345 RepID=UPI0033968FEF
MSDALDLIAAVIGTDDAQGLTAEQVLERALEREVDPLSYCANTLNLGQIPVMERAARWAGFAFFDVIPRGLSVHAEHYPLAELARARAVPLRLIDRHVFFSAPGFFEILALRTRLRERPQLHSRVCFVPEAAIRSYMVQASSEALVDNARQGLARRWPFATAQLELTRPVRIVFVVALTLLVGIIVMVPFLGLSWLLPLSVVLLGLPAVLRLAASWRGLVQGGPPAPPERPDDAELPVYSVLVPLRDEAHMVPQLYAALRALDYPPEKLDIKFVVEDRSRATIDAVGRLPDDGSFSLICVPDAAPRTKPKALGFALPACRGDFVVVFDAEDRPHPDQLWQAAAAFRDQPDVQCLQAELLIDNADEHWLAGLFAGEYAGLFGTLLPALAEWQLPMPLGGTSNHFRIAALRDIGGWDAFNVTEDADLGVRLARSGYRTAMLASHTLEEAPTQWRSWLGQRTRWMKGWMQTFIVHTRYPITLRREMGWRSMFAFKITVLSMIVSPLLHTALLPTLLVQTAMNQYLFGGFGWTWAALHLGLLCFGYSTTLALTLIGLHRQRRYRLMVLQLLLPFYWLLLAIATLRALHELLDRPFYWAKTEHRVRKTGLSVKARIRQTGGISKDPKHPRPAE